MWLVLQVMSIYKKRMSEQNNTPVDTEREIKKTGWKAWLKRLGVAGFLFFLIKGLVWLTVFLFAGSKVFEGCN